MNDEERHAQGMAVRRAVLGDAHVNRVVARTDEVTADFQDLITRYAWGDVWSRPGLDRHTRSCITVAMLATLHHDAELAMHLRAALRNGLSRADIAEILLQVAVYAGVPAANRAFAIAQETFAALDAEPPIESTGPTGSIESTGPNEANEANEANEIVESAEESGLTESTPDTR